MQKLKRGPGSVDWHKIKAEFLSTQISLNALRQKHGLATAYFFKKTKGWHAEKAALQAKAIGNLKQDITAYFESYIARACSILDKFARHYDALLDAGHDRDENGNITAYKPLPPDMLLDASKALAANLNTLQLLKVQAQPNSSGHTIEGDLHAAIMALIHVAERKQEGEHEEAILDRPSLGDPRR